MVSIQVEIDQDSYDKCMAQIESLKYELLEVNARAQALLNSMEKIAILGKEQKNDAG